MFSFFIHSLQFHSRGYYLCLGLGQLGFKLHGSRSLDPPKRKNAFSKLYIMYNINCFLSEDRTGMSEFRWVSFFVAFKGSKGGEDTVLFPSGRLKSHIVSKKTFRMYSRVKLKPFKP